MKIWWITKLQVFELYFCKLLTYYAKGRENNRGYLFVW